MRIVVAILPVLMLSVATALLMQLPFLEGQAFDRKVCQLADEEFTPLSS